MTLNEKRLLFFVVGLIFGWVVLGPIITKAFGATPTQLKATADSLRAATVRADSLYAVALNKAGASRCSTTVKAYLDTACADAKVHFEITIGGYAQDSMYVRLIAPKSSELYLVTQTVQAKALYASVTDDGTNYVALARKDHAIAGLQMMQAVATGNVTGP